MSFQDATPAELATELNALAAAATAHPITIVLVSTGSSGEIAVSATELATDGFSQAFPKKNLVILARFRIKSTFVLLRKLKNVNPRATDDNSFHNGKMADALAPIHP